MSAVFERQLEAERLAGLPIATAVSRGHELAAAVVACKGAIIPKASMPVWTAA